MSHGETNSDAKDEQHSAKVYGGKLMPHKLAVLHATSCSLYANCMALYPIVLCVHFTCISWMHWIVNSPALLNQKNQVQQTLLVSVKYKN